MTENDKSSELVIGTCCEFVTKSTNNTAIPVCGLTHEVTDMLSHILEPNTLMMVLSCLSKEKQAMEILQDAGNAYKRGSYYIDPITGKPVWIPVSQTKKCHTDKSDCTTAIVTVIAPPPVDSSISFSWHFSLL